MKRTLTFVQIKIQAYVWLGLPALLFLYGWMRWYVSVPLIGLLLIAMWQDLRKDRTLRDDDVPQPDWKPVEINTVWIVTVCLIPVLLLFLGMGGLLPQPFDYWFRNAVFYDLSVRDWPVVYEGDRHLCYYFAYWLPASLASKASGFIMVGDLALLIWGWWGVTIAYSLFVSRLGGFPRWWHLPFVLLFGFWDRTFCVFFESEMTSLLGIESIHEFYSNYISFSFADQLAMIFNQTLPGWIALPLIWHTRKNVAHLLLPCSLLFLFSPLLCIGISAAVAYWLIKDIRRIFSFGNLVAVLFLAVTMLFYAGNNNASHTSLSIFGNPSTILFMGVVFYILTLGIYFPFIPGRILRNPAFILTAVLCFLLPLLSMGNSDDLGRRAFIPLTIFITYCIALDFKNFRFFSFTRRFSLYAVTLIGMLGICGLVKETANIWRLEETPLLHSKKTAMMGQLDNRDVNWCYDNFIAEGESFYTRHLQKKP